MSAAAVTLLAGDMRERLGDIAPASIDACITDPPYHLVSIVKRFGREGSKVVKAGRDGAFGRASRGFMGKEWDGGDIAFRPDTWARVHRTLKPGAFVAAFSHTSTYDLMVSAMRRAGFVVRDQLAWVYGSGFPKASTLALQIDKLLLDGQVQRDAGGHYVPTTDEARAWLEWSTQLKPAWEPIALCQKPIAESSIARNVLKHMTGALHVGACRIGEALLPAMTQGKARLGTFENGGPTRERVGRYPANVVHDGSPEVESAFAYYGESKSPEPRMTVRSGNDKAAQYGGSFKGQTGVVIGHGDSGAPTRFFYSAKADDADRLGSEHPTVKPIALMAWLVRLLTPPGGRVLDPFAGSGSTGMACLREGFAATLIEREPQYCADIERRLAHVAGDDTPLFAAASTDAPAQLSLSWRMHET